MSERDDFDRTISFGENALSHLKRNYIPAYPRHYELWYTFAAGFNNDLNRSITEILKARGRISIDEMQHIYNTYLSPNRLGVRIEEVGGKVAREIAELANRIDDTLGAAHSYGASLRNATTELDGSTDKEDIGDIVRRLLGATLEIENQNQKLESQLVASKAELQTLHTSLEAIRYESLTDQLTTLANRKHFDQSIERAIGEARTHGSPLTLILADIDHFKRFNDSYGHQTGDQVLRLVALALKQNVKGQDVACRYGGEEFAIILPRTGLRHARVVAEHIREAVVSKELVKRSTGENLGRVTISLGVSEFQPGDSDQTLIDRADGCLYAAKKAGRNRVVSETEHPAIAARSVA